MGAGREGSGVGVDGSGLEVLLASLISDAKPARPENPFFSLFPDIGVNPDSCSHQFHSILHHKNVYPHTRVSQLSTLDHGAGRVGHFVSSSKANTIFSGLDGRYETEVFDATLC